MDRIGEGENTIRRQAVGRRLFRFTVDDVYAMQRLGLLSDKGGGELLDGVMLMRSSDVPIRLHSVDLVELYSAGIIPAEVRTEMIEGVIYHAIDETAPRG